MDADGTLTPEQQTAILAALDSVGGYDASQDAAAANGAVQQAVGAQAQTVQQVLAPLAGLDTTALKGSFGTVSTDAVTLLTMMNEMTGKLYNEQDNSATLYGGAVQLKEGTDQLLGGMEQILWPRVLPNWTVVRPACKAAWNSYPLPAKWSKTRLHSSSPALLSWQAGRRRFKAE